MKEKFIGLSGRFKTFFASRRFLTVVSSLVLIAIVAAAVNFWPRGREFSRLIINPANAADNFEVTATASDAAGIDGATAFTIKSKEPIADAAALKANIKITPTVEFDLKKISDREFTVTPKTRLEDRAVYRLLIASGYVNANGLAVDRDFSWAFQVKDQFKIINTLPADKATDVPLNSGIEVAFSNENFINFENSFSISPAVAGKFEKHGRAGVFIPAAPLAKGKIYTITVKPGVAVENSSEKLAAEFIFQFETAYDRPVNPRAYLNFVADEYEFGVKQTPSFSVYINSSYPERQVQASLYNYPSQERFVSELKKVYDLPAWSDFRRQLANQHDKTGLAKVGDYNLTIQNNDFDNVLALPESLPAGFYLLEAKLGEAISYVLLQVTDVSAYVQINQDKILFWVNRMGAADSIANASIIELNSGEQALTDASGVATFLNSNAKDYQAKYYAIASGGQRLILPVYLETARNDSPNNRYWNYFYTDRALYKPSDTIRFWGFLKSRSAGLPQPREAVISLEKNRFIDYYNEPLAVIEQKATVDSRGFFTGEMKFNNLLPDYYNLSIKIAGENEAVYNRYLDIRTYQKPAYEIKVTPVKKALFAGEAAAYNVETVFFDGTPAANLELRYIHVGAGGQRLEATVKTNGLGRAQLSFPAVWPDCSQNCAVSYGDSISLTPVRGELGNISGQSEIIVFGPKFKFNKVETKLENNQTAKISLGLNWVDLNNEENGYAGAPAVNQPVTVKITQVEYVAAQTGTYYDFINKLSYPIYRYEEKRAPLSDLAIITNSAGLAQGQFNLDPKKTYEVTYSARDEAGKIAEEMNYVYNTLGFGDDPRFENYFLKAKNDHSSFYRFNETVSLDVFKAKQPVLGPGRALFTKNQLGLVGYQAVAAGNYSFTFKEQDAPNVSVSAVWFDGKTYHDAGFYLVALEAEERKLKIEIKTDKAEYAPREEVTLHIKVTGPDGRGTGAEVNLNAIDAAFLSLGGGSYASPLEIYRQIDNGVLRSDFSHRFPTAFGGAEKGGGGETPRSVFPDNALFQSIKTDSGGNARIKFKLPDTVTSWDITAQAISDNLFAGSGSGLVKATLPFFINPLAAPEYLSSDRPEVRLNSYGAALKNQDQVKLSLEARSLGINKTEQTLPAFTSAYFSLANLVAGAHDLVFAGEFGSLRDSVLKQIKVIAGRLSEVKKDFIELKDGVKLSGSSDNWTRLTFMDYGRGRVFDDIMNLNYSGGGRVDQKIAVVSANRLIKTYYPDMASGEAPSLDIATYQEANGGLKLLPYSSVDLELSAKIAGLAADFIDRAALAGYFYGVLNDRDTNREEAVLALYGLASLNEPVLLAVKEYAALADLKPGEEIYLALAAFNIGDEPTTRELYNDLITRYGEASEQYSRLKIDDKNNDNNIRATALAAGLAAALGDNQSEHFWNYVADNQPADWILSLEEADYLAKLLPGLPAGAVKFSLNFNGQTIEKELNRLETYSIMVDSNGLNNLSPNVIAGAVGVISEYEAAARTGANSPYLSVSKKYFVNGRETKVFKAGDIVEVRVYPRLGAQALKSDYTITDILPSGLELISNLYSYGLEYGCANWYPREINGQLIRFNLYEGWDRFSCNRGDYFRYYAYVVAPGAYTVEPALIQTDKSPDVKSYGQYDAITVTR